MNTYVLATHNEGKIREIRPLLEAEGRRLMSMAEAGVLGEAEETGETFEENALLKAQYALERCGLPCIADDSGLVVDALGGAPGVHSARYAPAGQRKLSLLRNLEGETNRAARFVSVVVCLIPGEEPIIVQGVCEGVIARAPAGENGFGYDPIFYLPRFEKTFAQLTLEEKNLVSHRGQAFRALGQRLKERERR